MLSRQGSQQRCYGATGLVAGMNFTKSSRMPCSGNAFLEDGSGRGFAC